MKKFKKYKITVLSLKPRRGYSIPEDGIFLNEGDVLCGYSHTHHESNKYFDVWFNEEKNLDPDNYVTLGRIQRTEPSINTKQGLVYVTKLGKFHIQEVQDGRILANTH